MCDGQDVLNRRVLFILVLRLRVTKDSYLRFNKSFRDTGSKLVNEFKLAYIFMEIKPGFVRHV